MFKVFASTMIALMSIVLSLIIVLPQFQYACGAKESATSKGLRRLTFHFYRHAIFKTSFGLIVHVCKV
jgi:hypothetical protein